jgi:hypothetical protein
MMVPALCDVTIDNLSGAFYLMDARLASVTASARPVATRPGAAKLSEILLLLNEDVDPRHGAHGLSNATLARCGNPLDALAREQVETAAQAWRTGLFDLSAPYNADGLTPTVMGTYRFLMSFGPRAIDLRGLNVHAVNGMHLATILRSTYSWRGEIPGWREAVIVACKALERGGFSVEDAAGDLLED